MRDCEWVSGCAVFAAGLLADEMPEEIEQAFADSSVSLFPTSADELDSACSCPDWENPCKHIAAVYYLLGEEFDRDPFLLFTLRGLPREELLTRLHAVAAAAETAAPGRTLPPEPLASDPAAFWSGVPASNLPPGDAHPSAVAAPLLRRLGDFPFWRGAESLLVALTPTYMEAAQRGVELALRCTAQENGEKE